MKGYDEMLAKYIITAATVVTVVGTPAVAQEFDGPFVGVQGGYEQTEAANPTTELGILSYDDKTESFTGGLFAGYDKQIASNFVLGVGGSFDLSTNDKMNGLIGGNLASIDPEWSIDLTARAGFMPDPESLLYVRGGYTHAQVETNTAGAANSEVISDEGRDGWTVGAGYERKLLDNIYGRIEYRYADLSDGGDTWDRHRALMGVSYRF
jgi:outer membrane immunogenic protein